MRLYNIISVPKNSIRENEMRYSCEDYSFDPFRFAIGDFVKCLDDPHRYYRIVGIDREWMESSEYWVERLQLEKVEALQVDMSLSCDFGGFFINGDERRITLTLDNWVALCAKVEVGKDVFIYSFTRTPGIGRVLEMRDIGNRYSVTIGYDGAKPNESTPKAESPSD